MARTVRKVALCGSHSLSLMDAPWDDPSWEFWGHSSARGFYRGRIDRYFDLHPKSCWTRAGKLSAAYPNWLAKNTVPIYMQKRFDEVPAAVEYPKGRILTEFGDCRPYFTNHVAWMIALALTEGVATLGLFGINYSSESEYQRQRGSAEYWLGIASGRGVRVVLPEQCTLLRDPAPLYGYDSHDEVTGLLKAEYKPRIVKPEAKKVPAYEANVPLAQPPEHIRRFIEREEAENPRPEWAMPGASIVLLPDDQIGIQRTDGGV